MIAWQGKWEWLSTPWPYAGDRRRLAALDAGTTGNGLSPPARDAERPRRQSGEASLASSADAFHEAEITGQPLPTKQRTDDRYELLAKFQGILETLGFAGIVVLVDRVDEPHLINGSVEQMRALLWPMLDNKFLKHPGIGFKLLLPIELAQIHRSREIASFISGPARQAKHDSLVGMDRRSALRRGRCPAEGLRRPAERPKLRQLFDPAITDRRLMERFRGLRVPRHLFKFMYRLFVAHCNAYTDESPRLANYRASVSSRCSPSTAATRTPSTAG